MKPVGTVTGPYYQKIVAEVMTISVGDSAQSQKAYGLKFDEVEVGNVTGSNFLDFDELDELHDAISYIIRISKSIKSQKRDYTEALYVSRDGVKVGFYQSAEGEQKAFMDVDGDGRMVFLNLEHLEEIRKNVRNAIMMIQALKTSAMPAEHHLPQSAV
jgi:hypothetical protein